MVGNEYWKRKPGLSPENCNPANGHPYLQDERMDYGALGLELAYAILRRCTETNRAGNRGVLLTAHGPSSPVDIQSLNQDSTIGYDLSPRSTHQSLALEVYVCTFSSVPLE